MAEKKQTKVNRKKGSAARIDPIYQKFTKGVMRAISSTEFYEFFMDALEKAENEIQFSNRKLEKAVDLNWIDQIEKTLPAMQNIISSPRNVIREEELIVNAAHAKKAGPDVVRHLSQHAAFVEDYNEHSGDVRPSRLMQKYRDDSDELYENRLVFTTMEMAYHFVKIRHDALFEAMSDEYGAKLRVNTDMQSATETVHMEMFLHIKETESAIDTDERNAEIFSRISRIYRLLSVFMNSAFAQHMAKAPRVKGTIVKTNVLKKNPDYRHIEHLLEYLRGYSDIGYSIRVIEQSPEISETFQRDIFHNILFNYMVLKGYLEDESDRVIPTKPYEKQKTLKPKFIRQIIEELTEDYDLPDVEIRKVLIEELTKEQLMHEEAEERRRLVEEQARKKKEEAERIRQEKAAERERIRQEKEAERERIRQEKEAEKQRLFHERMMREAEDRRRSALLRKELERFEEERADRIAERNAAWAKYLAEQEDFADAARLVEEAEQRKQEQLERERRRKEEEKERARREKLLEEERIRQEKLRIKELERQEKLRQAERERQAELERQAERERQARETVERQIAAEREVLHEYDICLQEFFASLEGHKVQRAAYLKSLEEEKERWEQQRRERMAQRAGQKKTP